MKKRCAQLNVKICSYHCQKLSFYWAKHLTIRQNVVLARPRNSEIAFYNKTEIGVGINRKSALVSLDGKEGKGEGGGGVGCLKSVSLSRFLQWEHATRNWDEDDCDR